MNERKVAPFQCSRTCAFRPLYADRLVFVHPPVSSAPCQTSKYVFFIARNSGWASNALVNLQLGYLTPFAFSSTSFVRVYRWNDLEELVPVPASVPVSSDAPRLPTAAASGLIGLNGLSASPAFRSIVPPSEQMFTDTGRCKFASISCRACVCPLTCPCLFCV